LADFSACYAWADREHWVGASCQEVEGERRRWVATIVAVSARNVGAGDIEKTLALRNVQQQASAEWDARRPGLADENVRFDIQGPFQLDKHRLLLGEDDGAEVRSTRVSSENAADSVRLAHF